MSGFFSLSGKNHDNNQEQQDQHNQTAETGNNNSNNYNLFLLNKNEEIYSKGFEVWQQYYQLHHQRSHHQDVDFSIGPSSGGRRRSIGGGDEPGNYGSYNNNRSAAELGFRVMNHQGRGAVGSDGISCQDCGNQAKKDCEHMRCRTCCKSRGYPCQTHVKSTWVPAARRRERLQQQQQLTTTTTNSSLQTDQQQQQQLAAVRGGENPKRLREGDGRAGAGGSGGGFELGHFPAELSSPAVFRCVRVSAMDDAEEHLAYQTAVNIGGHVFKGILYDQGPESRYPGGAAGEGPSSAGLIGGGSHQQSLDLIAATTSNTNLTMLDPSIYPSSHQLSGFMAGTQFFLPPRP